LLDTLSSLSRTILKIEPLLLVVIAPFLMFPRPDWLPLLLVLPLLWLVRGIGTGHFIRRTPLDWAILLLLLMVLVSLYATYDVAFSLPKISGALLGAAAFYAVVGRCTNWRAWAWGLAAFLAAGLGVALLSLIGTRWPEKLPVLGGLAERLPPILQGLPGAPEGFNPNQVAGSLLWVGPPALALAAAALRDLLAERGPAARRWASRVFPLAAALGLILTALIFLSQSRAAWIGFALAVPLMLARLLLPGRWALPAMALILIAALAAGGWLVLDWASAPETAIPSDLDGGAIQSLSSLEGRLEIWSRALYGLQDFAFTGMGMNTFRRVVHVLYPLFTIAPDTDIAHAHNEFLQAGLDLGLPGLIAFVALHVGALGMLARVWAGRGAFGVRPALLAAFVLGLAGGLLAHMLYGLLDAVALGAKPGVLWWILLGLIAALYGLTAGAEGAGEQGSRGGRGAGGRGSRGEG
jgi:putative inorganic carbon (HCO3(-)) transporter